MCPLPEAIQEAAGRELRASGAIIRKTPSMSIGTPPVTVA